MSIQDRIQNIVNKIVSEADPEKVILFGSHAWGQPTKDSDVDLFVIQKSNERRLEREVKLHNAIYPAGIAVDVLAYTPEEVDSRLKLGDFFIKNILNRGKVLYAK